MNSVLNVSQFKTAFRAPDEHLRQRQLISDEGDKGLNGWIGASGHVEKLVNWADLQTKKGF